MDDKTVSKVLLDVQKEYARSNKIKVIPCRKQMREKKNSVQKKYI